MGGICIKPGRYLWSTARRINGTTAKLSILSTSSIRLLNLINVVVVVDKALGLQIFLWLWLEPWLAIQIVVAFRRGVHASKNLHSKVCRVTRVVQAEDHRTIGWCVVP